MSEKVPSHLERHLMTIFVIFLVASNIELESNLTPYVDKNAVNLTLT